MDFSFFITLINSKTFTHGLFQNFHSWSIPKYSPLVHSKLFTPSDDLTRVWLTVWTSDRNQAFKHFKLCIKTSHSAGNPINVSQSLTQNLKIFRRESKLLGSVFFFTRFCLWENPLTWQVLVCSRCSNIICIYFDFFEHGFI